MSDEETPVPLGDPLEPMSDEDIIKYARGVITNEYMLADVVNDTDWQTSLMLLLVMWKPVPTNASNFFLVPMAEHMNGRWLNGRVPGVTFSAICVPMESCEALLAKCDEFYKALHPEEVTADDGQG
jgi:hypothetical protein